ncbi:MAG: tetratricopeptide repeat protein [Verrucomicrobiota bacterium JB024]|nr:tetratricopeptide repeat protein [Verrucomicrobiota bacterium JB024]
MTLTELQQQTGAMIEQRDYLGVRPYLMEMVKRFEGESEDMRKSLNGVYFYLGVGYLVEYGEENDTKYLEEAIKWFQRLNKEFPNGSFAVTANLAMADAYRGLQKFNEAGQVYAQVLTPPLELRLNSDQRQEALRKIVGSYYIAKNWSAGLPWFKLYLQEGRTPDDQAKAAAALMEAYIAQGLFEDTMKLLPYLVSESPARYSLQLNVALLEAGDKLSKLQRFNEAMLMYRMVLTVPEIIEWQEGYLADLRRQLDLLKLSTQRGDQYSELETNVLNTQAQLDAIKKIQDYTPELKVRIARTYLLTGREWESFFAYKELVQKYPNHAAAQDFLYAAFSAASELKLTDEVIGMGESYVNNKAWKKYADDIAVKLCQFYLEKNQYEEFFDMAKGFLAENPESQYASQVIYLMGTTYVKLERFGDMIEQFRAYLKKSPKGMMAEGCHYWVGLGDIFMGDYDDAVAQFSDILQYYGTGAYAEDSLYRRGICYFGLEQYAEAEKDFVSFINKYPKSNLRGEVEYFLADIYATTGNLERALKHYSNVEKYTTSPSFIRNAYFQKGKLLEANHRYDEMARNFQDYMDKYRLEGDFTGALFELGRARELQGRPQDMLSEYLGGVKRFGNDPNAYGVDLILEVYGQKYAENRAELDQTLAFLEKLKSDPAFREKIISDRQFLFDTFKQNPDITMSIQEAFYPKEFREGLREDMTPVDEWLVQVRRTNDAFPKESAAVTLRRTYDQAVADGESTLAMRLAMALDRLDAPADGGHIYTEQDLAYASPETLIWIGKKAEDFDTLLARQAYLTVIEKHPESHESLLNAYLALGDLAMKNGQWNEAIGYFRDAQEQFPAAPEIVLAVMGQADALRQQGDLRGAREKYQEVIARREWRGAPQAEALYKTGLTYADEKDWPSAQAFFERVYIGYGGFPEWASAAYYESGQALQNMGRRDDARRTYDEFLANPSLQESDYTDKIKQARSSL